MKRRADASRGVARVFRVGARGSALSRAQTAEALELLARTFPGTAYRFRAIGTPGDRDLTTPIERSAPDFFTRDLDEAVRAGRVDFAVHSAKDLPERVADDLDWFWLPNRADARDCLVRRAGDASEVRRIGASSARRLAWAKRAYPRADFPPIRGAIDARVRQLLDGSFDAVLMAKAGLDRLSAASAPFRRALRACAVTPIPADELPPPPAQGALAVVFRRGDARVAALRVPFVRAVRFVSAGTGNAGTLTVAGARDLALADAVLHDALIGDAFFRSVRVAAGARLVPVGKRCGRHAMRQEEITRRLCDEARTGARVVRLKGGDAGLFGRLAEETDALAELGIPFVVRPGASALTVGTTGTGLLLTRRGVARGFEVSTPRSAGAELTRVLFMSLNSFPEEAAKLVARGVPSATPFAIAYDAGGPRERLVRGTLGEAARAAAGAYAAEEPGLVVVGSAARGGWPRLGELGGARILVTASEATAGRVACAVEDAGGRPVPWPLIELRAVPRLARVDPAAYDAIVLTSPSAVRVFFARVRCDARRLPAFFTCGAGTDAELRLRGVSSDVMPAADFSAAGLVAEIGKLDLRGKRVLRLRSEKAGPAVGEALAAAGARVEDMVLYRNAAVAPEGPLPPFDGVHFASASAVGSFLSRYGEGALRGKTLLVMGRPTASALPPALRRRAKFFDFSRFAS